MTKVVSKSNKTKYEVKVLIGREVVQHIVRADTPEEVRERINRAYGGRADIYSVTAPGRTEIWNE